MLKKTLLLITICLSIFSSLRAQDIIASIDTTQTPQAELDEVIVSASKDKSVLKKMPASVSLFSGNALETNQVNSLNQLEGLAANFVMPDYGSKLTSPVYIRGIGSKINSPSVGLYVDNVPYFEKAAFEFDFYDIERIEILKGPQGTLYGRNTMGGIINVLTRSPENYQGTRLNVSAANYGNYRLNASHYGKLNDKFAFSISGNYNAGEGYYTNQYFDSKVDDFSNYAFRGKLIFNLSDNLTLENIANFDQSEQGGYPYAILNPETDELEDINYNQASSYDRLVFSDGLKLDYKGQGWELSNTLSYQLLDDNQQIDQDFTSDSLYFVGQEMKQNMLSEELIVRSANDKSYKWLFGAFGFLQSFDKSVDVDVYQRNMWYLKEYDLSVSSFALFHQSTFNITKNFTVTAGLRYDYEFSELNYKYNLEMGGNNVRTEDTTYNSINDHVLLPKIALSYQIGKSTIYASYTTGYKPGGFNSTFEEPDQLQFKHEDSYNYEVGFKTSLFKSMIYAEVAGFYTFLKNQQIYRTVPSGRGAYLDNAGLSENRGFEIALKNREFKGFQGSIAYGYTHSKIEEYVKDTITNYNNNFTPFIPRHTFAVQLNQKIKIKSISLLDYVNVNLSYNQQGKKYWNLDNSFWEDTYGLLNAKLSLVRKHVQMDIWAKNILNTSYRTFLFEINNPSISNTYAQTNKPFQLGMNLLINF